MDGSKKKKYLVQIVEQILNPISHIIMKIQELFI